MTRTPINFPQPLEEWLSTHVVESFLAVELSLIREQEMRTRLDHAMLEIDLRDRNIADLERELAAREANLAETERALHGRIDELEAERRMFAQALEVVQVANQRYRATSMALTTRRLPAAFLPTLERVRRQRLQEARGQARVRQVLRRRANPPMVVNGVLNEGAFEIVRDDELSSEDEEAFATMFE